MAQKATLGVAPNLSLMIPNLNITEKTPFQVCAYLTHFLKQAPYRKKSGGQMGLSENALRNYRSFQQHFTQFQQQYAEKTLCFSDLNRAVVEGFTRWLLEEKQFSKNYAGRLLGTLKTLCLDAKKNEVPVHTYTQHISGFSQLQSTRIINILTFADLHAIENVSLGKPHLETTRNWLILGFWLGQRVSDLLTLRPDQLRNAPNGGIYVDILQKKTEKKSYCRGHRSQSHPYFRKRFSKKTHPTTV